MGTYTITPFYLLYSAKFWWGKTLTDLANRTPFTNILPSKIPVNLSSFSFTKTLKRSNHQSFTLPKFSTLFIIILWFSTATIKIFVTGPEKTGLIYANTLVHNIMVTFWMCCIDFCMHVVKHYRILTINKFLQFFSTQKLGQILRVDKTCFLGPVAFEDE